MQSEFTLALTGDSIINRRISVYSDKRFLSLIQTIRDADAAFTQLETIIHDYDGPEVYPSAEAGWTAMRSPRFVVDELKWAGFDMVSDCSNHSLDYSYGGLFSTWRALDDGGLPHAGTGRNLGEARQPAYLEVEKGRIALISMCTSATRSAMAGDVRPNVKGRPGVNPLRYHYVVDANTLDMIKQVAIKCGWWVTHIDNMWLCNPPGLHMALHKFVEGNQPGVTTVVDEDDAAGNLKSIREARGQADFVLVTLHAHEWDPDKGLSVPAKYIPPFARACIDAGADVFCAQGSHSLLRGIEVYKNKPILYDPGDFLGMIQTVTRLPADFFSRPGYKPELKAWGTTISDGFDALGALPKAISPAGGYLTAPVMGSVIAVCSLGEGKKLTKLELHPLTLSHGARSQFGLPTRAEGETAKKIIDYLAELSAPFGTKIEFRDGVGLLKL